MKFIAKTLHGLEELLVEELTQLGATNIEPLKRAVAFDGNKKILYQANLQLRTAIRILKPLHTFTAANEDALYKGIYDFDWRPFLDPDNTLAVDTVTNSSYFNHSKYAALKTKDAIVDQLREHYGERPSVDVRDPDLRVHIHINEDEVTISFDSSGDLLFKRGYRTEAGIAPINEVLAAGMILHSGWKADCDFIDPMCGSGTLPIEAAMIAHNIPPGWFRESFGFQKWKNFNPEMWRLVRREARRKFRKFDHRIIAADADFRMVRMAQRNAAVIRMDSSFDFKEKYFEEWQQPKRKALLIMNPPYDERLRSDHIGGMYRMIGDQLKQHFGGCEAWIISSNEMAMKQIGLRPSRRITLYNGAMECKFLKFELYAGSRRGKYGNDQ